MSARLLLGIQIALLAGSLVLVLQLLITGLPSGWSGENWLLAAPFVARSLIYAFVTAATQVAVGLAAALTILWLTQGRRAQLILITIFLLPYAVPATVIGLVFRFGLGAESAWAEAVSPIFGVPTTYWLTEHAFEASILASIWQFFPFAFLLCFLALKSLDPQMLRAAQSDGAPFRAMLSHIILARIWPILVGVFTLRLLFMLVKFDTPYVFTELINSLDDTATVELRRAVVGSNSPELGLIGWSLQLCALVVAVAHVFLQRRTRNG